MIWREVYQQLLKMDPGNMIGMYYYAKILTQMNRPAEAEALYKKMTLQKPEFEAAWLSLAALYENEKKYSEAIAVYRAYLEINPARIIFRVKIAQQLVKANKQSLAEKELKEALQVDPANRDVRTMLGLLYYEMKQFDAAAAQFLMILQSSPGDEKIRYLLANTLEQKGDLSAAFMEYQKISPDFELYANAQVLAAMIRKKEGRIEDAIAVMVRAIEKKDDQAALYLYLSSLHEEKKDMDAAEKIIQEGISRFPRNTDMYYVLGTLQEKTDRFEESIKSMRKVLDIDPQNADALNFIGYTYADRDIHLDEAEQMIVQALKIKPKNGYILDSLGWVHFKKKQYDSALKHLKEALELLPDDPNINEHIGDVYLKIGREQEALQYYRKAVKIDPANLKLKEKLENLINKK